MLDHLEPKVHPCHETWIDPVPGQILRLLRLLGPSNKSELLVFGPVEMLRTCIRLVVIGAVATATIIIRIASVVIAHILVWEQEQGVQVVGCCLAAIVDEPDECWPKPVFQVLVV